MGICCIIRLLEETGLIWTEYNRNGAPIPYVNMYERPNRCLHRDGNGNCRHVVRHEIMSRRCSNI